MRRTDSKTDNKCAPLDHPFLPIRILLPRTRLAFAVGRPFVPMPGKGRDFFGDSCKRNFLVVWCDGAFQSDLKPRGCGTGLEDRCKGFALLRGGGDEDEPRVGDEFMSSSSNCHYG